MKINLKKLVVIIIATFAIGGFFSFLTINNMSYYKTLKKPLNVSGMIFPIIWSILYLLMSISYYIISNNRKTDKLTKKIYWIQLIINSLWTLIFFGFKWHLISFICIILLIIFVIIMIIRFYNINKISSLIQIPYFLWLIFAGYLNIGIYILNK